MKLKESLDVTRAIAGPFLFLARKGIKYAVIAYASIFAYVATSSFPVISMETDSFLGFGKRYELFIEASPQQIHAAIISDALQFGVLGAIYASTLIAITIFCLRNVKCFAKDAFVQRRAEKGVAA